jgi:hypothetical protein
MKQPPTIKANLLSRISCKGMRGKARGKSQKAKDEYVEE